MAGKERSQTPISITSAISSSSEEEVPCHHTTDSYHVINEAIVESKVKISSQDIPKVDPTILAEIEDQANSAAKSLAWMTKYLMHKLSEMSNVTIQTTETYGSAVQNASNQAEENIRMMYGLMAKCEELNRKMKPVYEIQSQVQDIKQTLEILEAACK
eukprot:Seg3103.4 transcript_id=Seg3103.4/GoldUCD/mRNA.D3Y31 product="BLOC-1-related complex subunit 6" protein_id=Seg3103.4/GoldUCD/D3Y31